MTEFWGANVDELQRLATQLRQSGEALDGMRTNLTGLLNTAHWNGSDADRYRSTWVGDHSSLLARTAQALRDASVTISTAAARQTAASAAEGGILASAGVGLGGGVASVLGGFLGVRAATGGEPAPYDPDPKDWWWPPSWGNKFSPPPLEPYDGPLYNDGGPQMTDVYQGEVGDCWFASAVASLANSDPGAIQQMIHQNPDGTFTVTFHGPDGPVSETVDNRLYTTDGEPIYGGLNSGDQTMWFPIIEKAYAQWRGGYGDINGGDATTAMAALTGQSANEGRVGGFMGMSDGDCWNQIKQSVSGHQLITASTDSVPSASGLVGDHVYTVVGYQTQPDGSQWVTVRNPWGTAPPAPAGEGSMSIDDFRKYFANLQWTS